MPIFEFDFEGSSGEAAVSAVSQIPPGIDFELDDNGDLLIPLRLVTGLKAVAQGIRIRCKMIKGEFFANQEEGIPYIDNAVVSESEALLGQPFDEAKTLAAFRKVIAAAPGVLAILSLTAKYDGVTRMTRAAWRVRGDVNVENNIIADSIEV